MASSSSTAPVQRVRYVTVDLDEATEMIRSQYFRHEPSFAGDRDRFRMRIDSDGVVAPAGLLRIDHAQHTMHVLADGEPFERPTVAIPHFGPVRYTCGREEVLAGPRLAPMWGRSEIEWDDADLMVASLDLDGLRRVGADISGLPSSAVAFTAMAPVSPELGEYFAATVAHLRRDVLSNDEAMSSALARGAAFRELAVAMLAAFPNTTHTLAPSRGGVGAEPATVRRAVEFIDANAHRDVGLTEIAAAARLGVRGLQLAFRRHRDITPLTHLKRVRMERVHRDLQDADPACGGTVGAIAARWGFTHAGGFSVDYRRIYGCRPSDTLRR